MSFKHYDPGLEIFVDDYARVATVRHPFLGDEPYVKKEDADKRRIEIGGEIYKKAMNGQNLSREELLSFCAFMYSWGCKRVLAHNELNMDKIHRLRPGDKVFWHHGGDCPAIPGIYESKVDSVYIEENTHLVVPLVSNFWITGDFPHQLWVASENSELIKALSKREPTMEPAPNAKRMKTYRVTELGDVVPD
jgi:hypothetical protein